MKTSVCETTKVNLASLCFVGCSSSSSLAALDLPSALSPALLTSWAASLYSVASEDRQGSPVGSCLIRSQENRQSVFPTL